MKRPPAATALFLDTCAEGISSGACPERSSVYAKPFFTPILHKPFLMGVNWPTLKGQIHPFAKRCVRQQQVFLKCQSWEIILMSQEWFLSLKGFKEELSGARLIVWSCLNGTLMICIWKLLMYFQGLGASTKNVAFKQNKTKKACVLAQGLKWEGGKKTYRVVDVYSLPND